MRGARLDSGGSSNGARVLCGSAGVQPNGAALLGTHVRRLRHFLAERTWERGSEGPRGRSVLLARVRECLYALLPLRGGGRAAYLHGGHAGLVAPLVVLCQRGSQAAELITNVAG